MVWPLLGAAVAGGLATGFITSDEENRLKDATEGVMEGIGTGIVSMVSGITESLQTEFERNGVALVTGLTMIAIGYSSYVLVTSLLARETP